MKRVDLSIGQYSSSIKCQRYQRYSAAGKPCPVGIVIYQASLTTTGWYPSHLIASRTTFSSPLRNTYPKYMLPNAVQELTCLGDIFNLVSGWGGRIFSSLIILGKPHLRFKQCIAPVSGRSCSGLERGCRRKCLCQCSLKVLEKKEHGKNSASNSLI